MKTFIEKNFWSGLEDYFRHLGELPVLRVSVGGAVGDWAVGEAEAVKGLRGAPVSVPEADTESATCVDMRIFPETMPVTFVT